MELLSAFRPIFYQELSQFFLERGFEFFEQVYGTSHSIYAVHTDQNQAFRENVKKNQHVYLNSLYKNTVAVILEKKLGIFYQRVIPNFFNDEHHYEDLTLDFFISIYKKYPEDRKEMMKDFYNIVSHQSKNHSLFHFVDLLTSPTDKDYKKDVTSLINSLPISVLNASTISSEDILEYLKAKQFTTTEIKSFFFSFYKIRKNQIKDPKVSPKIRSFLLNLYNHDETPLEPYFSFFPALANRFKENKISFIEHENLPFSTNLIINSKKMISAFSVDNYTPYLYEIALRFLSSYIKKEYNLEYYSMVDEDKSKSTLHIAFLHSNPDFNKSILLDHINSFFKYLTHEPKYNVNKESVAIWFQQEKLRHSLDSTSNISHKKLKI